MTFIYEQFSEAESSEMRKKVEPYQMVMSFINGQVIDRDKNIIFLALGGQGDKQLTAVSLLIIMHCTGRR